MVSSVLKGQNPIPSMIGAAAGTVVAYPVGAAAATATSKVMQAANPFATYWVDPASGMARTGAQNIWPALVGNAASSLTQEPVSNFIQNGSAK